MFERRLATVGAFASLAFTAQAASALEPDLADLVAAASLEVPASFDIEQETAFVGITECRTMIDRQSTITAVFEPAFDPTTADGQSIVEDLYTFNVTRNSTAKIDCVTGELCVRVADEDVDTTTSAISTEVEFATLTGLAEADDCQGFDNEYFVRLVTKTDIDAETVESSDARMIIDTLRPTAPSGLVANATENTLAVTFTASPDSDVARYLVFYSSSAFDGGQLPDDLGLTSAVLGEGTSGEISVDLEPNGSVFVAVAAEDQTGNLSPLSGAVESSVVETRDFWELYKAAGGAEDGGCASTNGRPAIGSLMLFALFGLLVRRTRRIAR